MISTVTITGVDDSVAPSDLVDISMKYPYVEWGIHLCSNGSGHPACPSEEWLENLLFHADKLRLQGILHDRWERDILQGNLSLKYEKPNLWSALKRIQVDVRRGYNKIIESLQLIPNKEIILLTDNPCSFINGTKLNAYPLLSKDKLFSYTGYCGYEINKDDIDIIIKSKLTNFWISINILGLNLLEIEKCLDKVEDYITNDYWMKALLITDAIQKRILEHH